MERNVVDGIADALAWIDVRRAEVPRQQSVLVGISGIDGSGKGYLTERLVAELQARGIRANLAEHFYLHCIRFEEMFAQLILPLREKRSHCAIADFAEETAMEFRPHTYQYEDVDVIVLEGIYLLKPAYRGYFDLSFWVECTFETALERALQRGQEGLPPEETIRAYETIYFPAQRIHFERDDPRAAATAVIVNDPRLAGVEGIYSRSGPRVP
jgi:uridine kinase